MIRQEMRRGAFLDKKNRKKTTRIRVRFTRDLDKIINSPIASIHFRRETADEMTERDCLERFPVE